MSTETSRTYRAAHFVGHSDDGLRAIYESTTTPVEDTCRTLVVRRAQKVVPIVFVPGIMGSNLKAAKDITNRKRIVVVEKGQPVWRVDGASSMLHWFSKSADEYQLRLRHEVVTVDDGGHIPERGLMCQMAYKSTMAPAPLSVQQLRDRGWGEVSAKFYLPFLDWLEHSLNYASKDFSLDGWPDNPVLTSIKQIHAGAHPLGVAPGHVPRLSAEDIDALLSVDNPVHAFGYNWLQSNAQSGVALKARIQSIIDGYKAQGKQCEQVILVTHSMGGLVARAACKLHGMEDKVAGVFHGVMPTDGAAATYKRMVSGFGGEGGGLIAWITANILGPRGNFTTPTLALNAGPLELLPNGRYNDGKAWLIVKDASGQKLALPKHGDPYSEIYTEDKRWWKPCNEEWLNPAGLDQKNSFDQYGAAVLKAGQFHKKLQQAGDFHSVTHAHYGNDPNQKTYEQVTWNLDKALSEEQQASLVREDLTDADMGITLSSGVGAAAVKVQATLLQPDAAGDGTVPAAASARAVERAGSGGVMVWGNGYAHDESFDPRAKSEGPRAALHAVLHMLKTTGVLA